MNATDEQWAREIMGRELEDGEREVFDNLDSISAAVAAVTATLATKYRILACKYLEERVPTAPHYEVKGKVAELDYKNTSRR